MELSGERIYLGKWNSPDSRRLYDQLLANWLRSGRTSVLPQSSSDTPPPPELPPQAPVYTVQNLVDDFGEHTKSYYRKDGKETSEADLIRRAMAFLADCFGKMSAEDFGPRQIAVLQKLMLKRDFSRTYINRQILRIRRGFRWAVTTEKMQPTPKYLAMLQVRGLAKGRTQAREPTPVMPVADETINATIEHLPTVVADMVRFQRLTGCRPNEVCDLTPGAVERTSDVWIYRVKGHKMEHYSRVRSVAIGPRAQAVLRPYLHRSSTSRCFSPRDSGERTDGDNGTPNARHHCCMAIVLAPIVNISQNQNRARNTPWRPIAERFGVLLTRRIAIAALIPLSALVAFGGQAVSYLFDLPCLWAFTAHTPKPALLAGILIGFPVLWAGGAASGHIAQLLSRRQRLRPLWICTAALLCDVIFVVALYSLAR